jgi:CRP-like cAMP-binding protein
MTEGHAMGNDGRDEGVKNWSPGEIIFRRGEPGGDLHFIQSGEVSVYLDSELGIVELARLGKDDVLGVMSIFPGGVRTANARAVTNVTATVVPEPKVRRLVDRLPVWVKALFKDMMARLESVDSRLVEGQRSLFLSSQPLAIVFAQAAAVGNALATVGRFMAGVPLDGPLDGDVRLSFAEVEGHLRAIFELEGCGFDRLWSCYRQSRWLSLDDDGQLSLAALDRCRAFGQHLQQLSGDPELWDAHVAVRDEDLGIVEQLVEQAESEGTKGQTVTLPRERLAALTSIDDLSESLGRLRRVGVVRLVGDHGEVVAMDDATWRDDILCLHMVVALGRGQEGGQK